MSKWQPLPKAPKEETTSKMICQNIITKELEEVKEVEQSIYDIKTKKISKFKMFYILNGKQFPVYKQILTEDQFIKNFKRIEVVK